MTDIANMPAGPAMDRAVAKGPMGWTLQHCEMSGRVYRRWYKNNGNGGGAWHSMDGGEDWFAPSTNIAHAWEVVERMQARGLHVQVSTLFARWHVAVTERDDGGQVMDPWPERHEAVADTAPLSICRAALLAVGSEA